MSDKGLVKELGHIIGFGNMMHLAQECWKELDIPESGVFAVGPCLGFTVPCWCNEPQDCDFCAGSGWVTKGVFRALAPSNHQDATDLPFNSSINTEKGTEACFQNGRNKMHLHSDNDKWVECSVCSNWLWDCYTEYDKESNTYTCLSCKGKTKEELNA